LYFDRSIPLLKKIVLISVPAVAVLLFSFFKSSSETDTTIPNGAGQWAAFGSYKNGDSIIYLAGKKWRPGNIMEAGKPYNAAAKNSVLGELQYKVAEGGDFSWPDWKDFSQVAGPKREKWWTDFFTGEWKVGEVMAVNTYVKGQTETTEFDYRKASETLKVLRDGSCAWKTSDGKLVKGRWIAMTDGPGIVLQKGYKGYNWTFINQSNAVTMHIRKLENGRLLPDGPELSKAATRSIK
jgi:hypothetical protein